MLSHDLAIAFRGLTRQRLHTLLTVAVLALGLACFIAAEVFAMYLDSFDRHLPNSERIHVLYQASEAPANGYSAPLTAQTAIPVAAQLSLEVPQLAAVARFLLDGVSVSVDDTDATFRRLAFADAKWPEIFRLDAVAGRVGDALAQPRTAILTAETAKQLFGATPAVGQVISITARGKRTDVTVAAVVADIAAPSHLANGQFTIGFEILCSWDVFEASYPTMPHTSWIFPAIRTYVLLPDDDTLDLDGLNSRLRAFSERELPEAGAKVRFEARHVSRLTKDELETRLDGAGVGGALPTDATTVLFWFGAGILGIACLNFINLTVARSASRAREIGVRKSLGATSLQIVYQDLVQTAITVLLAVALALAAIWVFSRTLEDRWRVVVDLPWSGSGFWLFLGGLLVTVTIAAGLYPALTLARVGAASALRLGTKKAGSRALRTVLVGAQFAAAAFLSLAVAIAYLQAAVLREATIGRLRDPYVVLTERLRVADGVDFDVVAAEIARGPGIKGVAGVSPYPWQEGAPQQQLARSPGASAVALVGRHYVSHDYFSVMDMQLLAGRWFARDRADDSVPLSQEEAQRRNSPPRIVIDRRAATELGWSTPEAAIGELVYGPQRPIEIIGVVENMPLALRSRGNNAFIYFLAPELARTTLVRLHERTCRLRSSTSTKFGET